MYFFVSSYTDTSNITESELITVALEDMLNNYDKRIRPGYGGDPVEVTLNINIRSLGPISEMDMAFTMDCYFRQVWTDPRLAMNSSNSSMDFIQLSIKILERIWFPDTVFYNGMKSYLHTITTPNRFIRIYRDGKILFSQRKKSRDVSFEFYCTNLEKLVMSVLLVSEVINYSFATEVPDNFPLSKIFLFLHSRIT
ncbi:Gamma-aminobutyric acid receptor subunit alpha-4 [Mactra antiquata]